MTNKQIATILNSAIMQNEIGTSVIVTENLDNIIDYGTVVSSLTPEKMKNFQNNLIVQIHNVVIAQIYEMPDFRILKSAEEYGGALQRIMSGALLSAQDSFLLKKDLANPNKVYHDGKYYGVNLSAKVYDTVDTFKVVHSVSDDDWRLAFTSADEMRRVMSVIEITERNTITAQIGALVRRVILAMVVNCHDNNRKVKLLTAFNTKVGGTYTLAQIYADRDLTAYFSDFCKSCITKVQSYVQSMNQKYNDGTVPQFTRKSDIVTLLLQDFASDIKYLGDPSDHNIVEMGKFDTISHWQNATDDILPNFDDISFIEVQHDDEEWNYSNTCAIIYDVNSAGVTTFADKVTTEYVGAEGFTNYHHHLGNRYFYDSRMGSVVFTLD